MPRAPKREYELIAREMAEARLLGKTIPITELVQKYGLKPTTALPRIYKKNFQERVEKYVEMLRQAIPQEAAPSVVRYLEDEVGRELLNYTNSKFDEFKNAFETLIDIMKKGESKDEVRRKAAVNIIEVFLQIRSRQQTSVEAKLKGRLPPELQQEIELIVKRKSEASA